jgi:hypothetical protein
MTATFEKNILMMVYGLLEAENVTIIELLKMLLLAGRIWELSSALYF